MPEASFRNFDPVRPLIFLGVIQVEEIQSSPNVVIIRMGKGHHVQRISIRFFEVVKELRAKVNAKIVLSSPLRQWA